MSLAPSPFLPLHFCPYALGSASAPTLPPNNKNPGVAHAIGSSNCCGSESASKCVCTPHHSRRQL